MKFFAKVVSFGFLLQFLVCDQSTATTESTTETPLSTGSIGRRIDRDLLRNKLFSGYNKKTIPDDVDLNFGMSIIKFDLDEKKGTFEVDGWLKYVWTDDRLAWDSKEYNIDSLHVCPKEIWKPDITLFNNANPENMVPCGDSNAIVFPTGMVIWIPPCHFSAHCNQTFTQTSEGPEQSCTLKFGSWTFDGNSMKLSLYKNEAKANVDDLYENNRYKLTANKATWVSKYYSCCKEPYPYIGFDFSFRKKSEFCV